MKVTYLALSNINNNDMDDCTSYLLPHIKTDNLLLYYLWDIKEKTLDCKQFISLHVQQK